MFKAYVQVCGEWTSQHVIQSVTELVQSLRTCVARCSVRYVGVFTAGLVLYRVTVDCWNMLPHLTHDCVR